ncbi:MAG: CTP synthase, partial [Planctomycetia bacterium]
RENVLFIHLTLVPYLKAAGEAKTKPTQHSVGQMRQIGIQPDILICRTERPLDPSDREKIALFCNVERKAVIEERDKDFSIYEVPLSLRENGLDDLIVRKLNLKAAEADLNDWQELLSSVRSPKNEVSIAVVGKYVKHKDAYKSIYEALDHAGINRGCRVVVKRIESEEIEQEGAERLLAGVDGILVPGGFGVRGIEGKIATIQYAREKRIPFFGICLGMQCAVIEFARNVLGYATAHSTEFVTQTEHPVICLMNEQKNISDKGGTMRLGAYDCALADGSHARRAYGKDVVSERHRHRYEFNNQYANAYEAAGMNLVGKSPDGKLVEIVEIPNHPWFLAVQYHPEFKSKLTQPHPLFHGFVGAGLARRSV